MVVLQVYMAEEEEVEEKEEDDEEEGKEEKEEEKRRRRRKRREDEETAGVRVTYPGCVHCCTLLTNGTDSIPHVLQLIYETDNTLCVGHRTKYLARYLQHLRNAGLFP